MFPTIPPIATIDLGQCTQTPVEDVGPHGVPLQAIALFREFRTRQEFRAAFGVDAPPFDPRHAPRYWMDPGSEQTSYTGIVLENGVGVEKSLQTGGAQMVNLPGIPEFPPLDRSHPTELAVSVDGLPFRRMEPDQIATFDEAEEILRNLVSQPDRTIADGWQIVLAQDYFPEVIVRRPAGNTDPRDFYLLVNSKLKGFSRNVGKLWTSQREARRFGRYYPGFWKFLVEIGEIIFDPRTLAETNSVPEFPVPTRPLKPGERVVAGGPMGRGIVIKDPPEAPGGANLQEMLMLLREIHAALVVQPGKHPAFE